MITLVVAYLCTLAGSAVTFWFSEMVTSTDVRVGSLAVTSALSMIAAVASFVWRCLK
ncbi:hypothetical protein [uncultured Jatrophihabitans sp.]|uniref:hypothetical protein n=1 Tax=uncultured Jatrophihabitans sp. TaxID=1610747 RepID=UPI0035C96DB6